jgi:hypothetical protein
MQGEAHSSPQLPLKTTCTIKYLVERELRFTVFDFTEVIMHQVRHLRCAGVEKNIGERNPGLLLVERVKLTHYVLLGLVIEEVQAQLLTNGKVLIHLWLLRCDTGNIFWLLQYNLFLTFSLNGYEDFES